MAVVLDPCHRLVPLAWIATIFTDLPKSWGSEVRSLISPRSEVWGLRGPRSEVCTEKSRGLRGLTAQRSDGSEVRAQKSALRSPGGSEVCRLRRSRPPDRVRSPSQREITILLKRLNAILWPTPLIVCLDLVVGCTKVSHYSWKWVNPSWELGQLFGPLFRALLRAPTGLPPAEGACLAAGETNARPRE